MADLACTRRTQYTVIAKMAAVALVLILALYMSRDAPESMGMSSTQLTTATAVSFITGAFLSAVAGYAGMWCAVRANSRVGAAAATSYNAAIQVALRSGAIAALLVVSLVLLGICLLFTLFYAFSGGPGGVQPHKIPLLLVGYGVGSFRRLIALLRLHARSHVLFTVGVAESGTLTWLNDVFLLAVRCLVRCALRSARWRNLH